MPLNRSREPFSSPDWVFELKYDGFRALAKIEYGRCRLISRNGNAFATFQDLALRIGRLFPQDRVVLDGEIACLDKTGRHDQGKVEYIALLESFATHARNLIEFFYFKESEGYVRASQFFDDSSAWSPSRPPEINKLYSRACNEVTHLTTGRINGNPPDKDWYPDQVLSNIETIAKEFAAKASDKKLHPKVREFLGSPSNEMLVWIGNNVTHSNVTAQTHTLAGGQFVARPGIIRTLSSTSCSTHTEIRRSPSFWRTRDDE